MPHPFGELIGLELRAQGPGKSECALVVAPQHLNPHRVVHGAVLYAMADSGMGAALVPTLDAGELCATIQITMHYFKPVSEGAGVACSTELVHRGKRVAHLESRLHVGEQIVATASGSYAIFRPGSHT
jgi:acyl-CoA thioesterase